MTPKEKAIDLVNKFDLDGNYLQGLNARKAQSLICVDEIIKMESGYVPGLLKLIDSMSKSNGGKVIFGNIGDYWREVKQEIERL